MHNFQNPLQKTGQNVDTLKSVEDPAGSTRSSDALAYELFKSSRQYQLIDRKNKRLILYDNASVKYHDIELRAGIIIVNYAKKEVYAGRIPDSTGKLSQKPVFKQGATEITTDSIRFNFETKRALVWNSYTKDGDISMISSVTKKVNDSTSFAYRMKITTSEDTLNPEYYILVKKGKIVPGKKIVVGTSIMFIEEIPTPLVLPFGYFPLVQKRTSGFILPTYGENQRGFFLQNLGFYLVLSKYADMALLGDIYTNGSFGYQIRSNYKKRYAFDGHLVFRSEKVVLGELGQPDFQRNKVWNLRWTHSKDPKSNPNYNFSANVNLGSSKYYRYSYNQQNLPNVLNNTLSSSVNLSKRFHSFPLSASLSLNQNQNANTGVIQMTLPDFYAKVDRIYPFAPKSGLKKNLFQRLNLDYTLRAQNRITTNDTLFLKRAMWNDAVWGINQRIPLSTNFKLFRYLNVNTSAGLTHVVYGFQRLKYWDDTEARVVDTLVKKPAQFLDWNWSAGMSTVLYGIFKTGEKHKIQAIRHIVRPQVNFTYHPGLKQYQQSYQASADVNDWRDYTVFDGGFYGAPSLHVNSIMNFSLSNTFEAKVKGKDGKVKKVSFLKNLNLSGSYNFKADSLKLSFINISGGIEPVKGLPVRISGSLDPYAVDTTGKNIDVYAYKAGQGLVNLRMLNVSTGFSLNNQIIRKLFGRKEKAVRFIGEGAGDAKRDKEDEAYHNPIEWNLNISYNLVYSNKRYQPLNPRFRPVSTHSISFRGNVKFSPGWSVNFSSAYDLVQKKLGYTLLNFRRDLKSWYMTFTWRPLPPYTSWYFYIGIKSSVLRDIKYERRKESFKRFF